MCSVLNTLSEYTYFYIFFTFFTYYHHRKPSVYFIFISCWVFMFLLFWIWNVLNSISFRVTEDTRLFYKHRVPKRIVSTLMLWNLKFLKYQLSKCGFFRTNSDSLVFDSIYVYLYIHIDIKSRKLKTHVVYNY